jgi:hypothetical protein
MSLSNRRVLLVNIRAVSNDVEDFWDFLEESVIAERRLFINSFVKQIDIIGYEAILHYSIPMVPEKLYLDNRVPPTVSNSG